MKKVISILFFSSLCYSTSFSQGVGINQTGAAPHSSAGLDVDFNNKGFLPPRLTQAERDAIPNPQIGLTIYNTESNCINYFNGVWFELCGQPAPVMGVLSGLDCNAVQFNGTIIANTDNGAINFELPYTTNTQGVFNAQQIVSTGVQGLFANLLEGSFEAISGNLIFEVTGVAESSGIASFQIVIGSQECSVSLPVFAIGDYRPGTQHCQPTPTSVVELLNPVTGRTWMDRNLGASQAAQSSTDVSSYGDLYQWGRFADGHQCRNSTTTASLANSDTPNPPNFILNSNQPVDWRSPSNVNLWQTLNSNNNPCPFGYRVPSQQEFENEISTWWLSQDLTGAFNALKIPAGGFRIAINSNLNQVDSQAFFWTRSVFSADYSVYLSITPTGYSFADNIGYRARGHSIRCIKD